MTDIKLDFEAAVGVTKCYLREDYRYITESLSNGDVHPADRVAYERTKEAIETLFEVWLGESL